MAVPTDIASCKIWHTSDVGVTLDGSSKLQQWDDRTGLGNHSAQSTAGSRPTRNLRAYPNFVEFGQFFSGAQWLQLASLSLNSRALSAFAVIRNRTSELLTKVTHYNCFCSFPDTGASFIWNASATPNTVQLYNGIVPAFSARAGMWTTPHVIGFTSGTSNFKYFDGSRIVSTSAASNNNWTGGRLGRYSGAIGLDAFLSAFLLFDSALSDADALSMVDYLQTWAGRAAQTLQVVCTGDSIMCGQTFYGSDIPNTPERLGVALPASRVVDLAKSGTTIHAGSGGGATQGPLADGLFNSATTNILIVEHGSNNLFASESAATLEGRLQTFLSDRATAATAGSYTVRRIVCSIIARGQAGWTGAMETERTAYNTWLRDASNQATYNYTLCDVAALAAFSNANDTTYYQADKTHPNATGAQLYADTLAATINTLISVGHPARRRLGLTRYCNSTLEVGRTGVMVA